MRPLEDRSLGDLLEQMSSEMRTLVRKEVELAKLELGQKASTGGRKVGLAVVGGVLAYTGWLVLLAAAVAAIALVLPVWAAALIVGGALVLGGGGLLAVGLLGLLRLGIKPERTLRTLKEDQRWLQTATST